VPVVLMTRMPVLFSALFQFEKEFIGLEMKADIKISTTV
jgi:hypothetical protein